MYWKRKIKIILLITIGGVFMLNMHIYAKSNIKTIEVDASKKTGKVIHGAIGGHYALSEPEIPSLNVLSSLRIFTVNQKPPYGLQHPGADVLKVAETFFKAGGKFLQVYLQDIYANWPYEKGPDLNNDGIPDDYLEKVKNIVLEILKSPYSSRIYYVPFNEPDAIWYNTDPIWRGDVDNSVFLKAWKNIYDFIKSIDKKAIIVGPNLAIYKSDFMKNFINFCKNNDCLPDIVSWHELNNRFYGFFEKNYLHYREIEKELNIEPRQISINEYGTFCDLSVPGKLVQWISRFEKTKVSACLAYWHTAGNFNDLVVENNSPNGAWWLYKWYSDMEGETLEVKVPYPNMEDLAALASVDEKRGILWVLFGGDDTDINIEIKNLPEILSSRVYVKVYKADWSGYDGALFSPTVVYEDISEVTDRFLKISISKVNKTAAYFLILQKTNNSEVLNKIPTELKLSYEAELSQFNNCEVFSDNTEVNPNNNMYSGGKGVYLRNNNSSVLFEIVAPQTGTYLLDVFYSNGNRVNNNGFVVEAYLRIDDGVYTKMILNPTTNWRFVGKSSTLVYLKAGKHKILISRSKEKKVSSYPFDIDKIELTFLSSNKVSKNFNPKVYEAEEARLEDGLDIYYPTLCSGASGVLGIDVEKGVRFIVSVDDNGYYNIKVAYATYEREYINMKISLNNGPYKILTLPYTEGVNNFAVSNIVMFLEKGVNIIEVRGVDKRKFCLDYIEVEKTDKFDNLIEDIEAEDKKNILGGIVRRDNSLYASSGAFVSDIGFGEENFLAMRIPNLKYGEGYYAIVIYYSNGEILGTHQYNVNLVDRCAILEIEGKILGEFYFRNTNSFDTFKTKVVYAKLEGKENLLKLYNPYKISSAAFSSPWAPSIDKIYIVPVFVY